MRAALRPFVGTAAVADLIWQSGGGPICGDGWYDPGPDYFLFCGELSNSASLRTGQTAGSPEFEAEAAE